MMRMMMRMMMMITTSATTSTKSKHENSNDNNKHEKIYAAYKKKTGKAIKTTSIKMTYLSVMKHRRNINKHNRNGNVPNFIHYNVHIFKLFNLGEAPSFVYS